VNDNGEWIVYQTYSPIEYFRLMPAVEMVPANCHHLTIGHLLAIHRRPRLAH